MVKTNLEVAAERIIQQGGAYHQAEFEHGALEVEQIVASFGSFLKFLKESNNYIPPSGSVFVINYANGVITTKLKPIPLKGDDTFDAIIEKVVKGQIRSYLNDHPEMVEARQGKLRKGVTKSEALTSSIAKRILGDLKGEQTRLRLKSALEREQP